VDIKDTWTVVALSDDGRKIVLTGSKKKSFIFELTVLARQLAVKTEKVTMKRRAKWPANSNKKQNINISSIL
jgi:hypothetical protein